MSRPTPTAVPTGVIVEAAAVGVMRIARRELELVRSAARMSESDPSPDSATNMGEEARRRDTDDGGRRGVGTGGGDADQAGREGLEGYSGDEDECVIGLMMGEIISSSCVASWSAGEPVRV